MSRSRTLPIAFLCVAIGCTGNGGDDTGGDDTGDTADTSDSGDTDTGDTDTGDTDTGDTDTADTDTADTDTGDTDTADTGDCEGDTSVACQPSLGLNEEFWITDGDVYALTESDGILFVGGNFDYVGPQTGAYARLTLDSADVVAPTLAVNGPVHAMVADGSGGLYIGGEFTHVDGTVKGAVAHLLADGTLDPAFSVTADDGVFALALGATSLYVCGNFQEIGGETRNWGFASVDPATGAVTSWDPGFNVCGNTLALTDGKLIAGGDDLTAWDDATGTLVSSWTPFTSGAAAGVAAGGGAVFAVGHTLNLGGSTYLGRVVLSSGVPDTNFDPGVQAYPEAILYDGGTLYVAGSFETVNEVTTPVTRNLVAALNPATGAATSWTPDWDPNAAAEWSTTATALAVSADRVYVGFTQDIIGGDWHGIAAFDRTTGALLSWDAKVGGEVTTLLADSGQVHVGTKGQSVGGVWRRNLVAIDATTGVATDWDPAADGEVYGIDVNATTVYVAGEFIAIGGQDHLAIAAVDRTTGDALDWAPAINDWGYTDLVALGDGVVYVGGNYEDIGGASRYNLAAIDLSTALATSWDAGLDGSVGDLLVEGDTVTLGGYFDAAGGEARRGLAALDATTAGALPFDPDLTFGSVQDLVRSCDTLYAGGSFIGMSDLDRPYTAALVGDTVQAWRPDPDDWVDAIAPAGRTVYLGGEFNDIGGQERNYLAAVDASSGAPCAWNPDPDQDVEVLLWNGTRLYVGGFFHMIGDRSVRSLAVFDP